MSSIGRPNYASCGSSQHDEATTPPDLFTGTRAGSRPAAPRYDNRYRKGCRRGVARKVANRIQSAGPTMVEVLSRTFIYIEAMEKRGEGEGETRTTTIPMVWSAHLHISGGVVLPRSLPPPEIQAWLEAAEPQLRPPGADRLARGAVCQARLPRAPGAVGRRRWCPAVCSAGSRVWTPRRSRTMPALCEAATQLRAVADALRPLRVRILEAAIVHDVPWRQLGKLLRLHAETPGRSPRAGVAPGRRAVPPPPRNHFRIGPGRQ